MQRLRVGELARRTGLTVRTLHHYDQIGLLAPSARSAAGYRLYAAADVERLTQILLLRRLGLTLVEVREILAKPDSTLRQTLGQQIAQLKHKVAVETELIRKLEAVYERLDLSQRVSIDQLTTLLEMITMFEKHYTPEQAEYLAKRREELGEEKIRQAEAEWPQLIARMREQMKKGTDPADPTVQALARRWRELVEEFTGGDPGITEALRKMYGQEPGLRQQTGLDPALMEYVGRVNNADGVG